MEANNTRKTVAEAEGLKPWPDGGLENVDACPVCSSSSRTVLYQDLVDKIFFVAPGRWNLWSCNGCRSAYLDPRPNEKTIGLAYSSYYTHSTIDSDAVPSTLVGRLRRSLANGYLNDRFGVSREPSLLAGKWVARGLPNLRANLDYRYRNMPRCNSGGKLLDVGFGDGSFLRQAEAAGWAAYGIDTDPVACENATKAGLKVECAPLSEFVGRDGDFDYVTMAHVIEHVHDPRTTLEYLFDLIAPGGQLWIDTPNISSAGHKCFAENWHGLDAPRHLVLFNWASISQLLTEVGFRSIKKLPYVSLAPHFHMRSRAIRSGRDPYSSEIIPMSAADHREVAVMDKEARRDYRMRETINLVALK